jgi:hypothetical protein
MNDYISIMQDAYNGATEKDWDYYYKEIMNPNLPNNKGVVPILKNEIQQSGIDQDGKTFLLQKLKQQAERIGVPFDEASSDWGNRELGGPDEVPAQDPHAFGGRDDEFTREQIHQKELKDATEIFGQHKGLNADWAAPAWHLSGTFPYGLWLVDDNESSEGLWSIINRQAKPPAPGYTESGEYEDTEVASGDFMDMLSKANELYKK